MFRSLKAGSPWRAGRVSPRLCKKYRCFAARCFSLQIGLQLAD
jgi:hypothetical protein